MPFLPLYHYRITVAGQIVNLVFIWIYRKAVTNFSREPGNRVQKVYGASLAGNLILLAGTENSANGISWLILVIGSK